MTKSKLSPIQFKILQNKWYNLLKDKGFQDIEDTKRPERPLKAWHAYKFNQVDELKIVAAHQYYSKCLELLNNHNFARPIDKIIWELHCEGFSQRQIVRAIVDMPDNYSQSSIHYILKNLKRLL